MPMAMSGRRFIRADQGKTLGHTQGLEQVRAPAMRSILATFFSDLFGPGFGSGAGRGYGRMRGRDVRFTLDVDFLDAINGARRHFIG